MKRQYLLISLLVLTAGVFSFFLLMPKLDYSVLLNTFPQTDDFKLTLFYSDISMKKIEGFEVSKGNVSPLNKSFQSYTEGFLPHEHTQNVLATINTFRKMRGEVLLTYFHDYYEDDDWIIVSFTGGLETIYFIDKETWLVSLPAYTADENLGKMYVSHIRKVADTFVIIGGQANAYNAFVYTLDAKTLTLITAKSIATDPSAVSEEHYTIDSKGNAVFISGNGLDVLSYQTNNQSYQSLPFKAHYVLSNAATTAALSVNSDLLQYALFDSDLTLSHNGSLPLPNKNVILVNVFFRDNYLYVTSFDSTHKLYRNYIAVYNLDSNKLIYCLALHQYKSLALLKSSF